MSEPLKSPYVYFGAKSAIAAEVWARFGKVTNVVEPFFGSGAVLLARPKPFDGTETICDLCGFVCNFWRSIAADPDAVAHHADWIASESDLHARHSYLVGQKESLQSRLEGDESWYDAKIAGYWCYGMALWIGGGFCSAEGPWHVVEDEHGVKRLVKDGGEGDGVKRKCIHMGNKGRGVQRRRIHLHGNGMGVQRSNVSNITGDDLLPRNEGIYDWFRALADRFARVRVCCGDWSRVCTPTVTTGHGVTAVFLDPPYSGEANRDNTIYAKESLTVAHDVREWCLANGRNKLLRIALCGYEGEGHEPLEDAGWRVFAWKAQGGMANQGQNQGRDNAKRERVWFSPYCHFERGLFDEAEGTS